MLHQKDEASRASFWRARGRVALTLYRHAIWLPSDAWQGGYQYGAPVEIFKRNFATKVRELGVPLLVWESESLAESGPQS